MRHLRLFVLIIALAACSVPANAGLVFVISYTPAVQGNANFAAIQAAVNYVTTEYSDLFHNSATVRFTVEQQRRRIKFLQQLRLLKLHRDQGSPSCVGNERR
jgi:hypothetical protein